METSYRNSWFLFVFFVTCGSVFIANVRLTIRVASLSHNTDSLGFEMPRSEAEMLNHLSTTSTTSTNDGTQLTAAAAASVAFLTPKEKRRPVKAIEFDARFPRIQLILLRAIGNALPPRHDPEQAYENLKFTLEHEYEFPYLEKMWLMNRIIDQTLLHRLEALLESHDQKYIVIPFNLTEYSKVQYRFDYFNPGGDIVHDSKYVRGKMKGKKDSHYQVDEAINQDKNVFVTNQNAARNAMIQYGQDHSQQQPHSTAADWILPWDGNCFLHPIAYQEIYQSLQAMPPTHKYAYTSMNRAASNDEVLQEEYRPHPIEEPQVMFHKTAVGRFHPKLRYGRRNKVEFLQRLHIKGPWDSWSPYLAWEEKHLGPFLQPISDLQNIKTDGKTRKAGFVTRLASGQQHLEVKGTIHARGESRFASMALLLGQLDTRVAVELYGYRPGQLVYYHQDALERDRQLYQQGDVRVKRVVDHLEQLARMALTAGPWSVTDKPDGSVAASGDKHDYYHLSPYYWPKSPELEQDPTHKWIRHDGKRYPGTELHEPGSEKFDRTRVKDMQYNTTVLGLAYFMTGEKQFAQVAARNVRTWFLDPQTRMNPNMNYAQVKRGYNNNSGISFGIIEMKDLYFMLDAVRIIEKDGYLTETEQSALREWFREYLNWMETKDIAKDEYVQKNNHGLYFDVQATAIASFIQDTAKMIWYLERSTSRLLSHIAPDGSMPEELIRPTCEHYQMFTLQGWSVLSRMAETVNRNRWTVRSRSESTTTKPTSTTTTTAHSPLCRAARYAIPFFGTRKNRCKKSNEVGENMARWWPLWHDAKNYCPGMKPANNNNMTWPVPWFPADARRPPDTSYDMPNVFDPHDGIAPFWNLGLRYGNVTL